MTKSEIYLATINGEYTGMLPKPNTKIECYLYKLATAGSFGSGSGSSGADGKDGKDGRGIVSIDFVPSDDNQTPGKEGSIDTYRISYSDNTYSTFVVQNGTKGDSGQSITVKSTSKTDGKTTVTFSDNSSITIMDGVSIDSIEFDSSTGGEHAGISGATDNYKITYSDGNTSTISIYNGKDGKAGTDGKDGAAGAKGDSGIGIKSIEQTTTSTANNGENVITVTLSDGTTTTFKVRNGSGGVTPYIGSNGNWYTDVDTGVPATLSKQSIEIKKIPKSHGVDILIESASELSDLHAKKIFRYGGKVLICTDHNIEIYDELPDSGSGYSGSSLGRITFTNDSILVKKMEFIYDARNSNALLVYVLGTDNKLYFGTIDITYIKDPTSQEVYLQTMPGLMNSVVDDLCVHENKVYVLVDAQVIRFPSLNGDPQNSTAVSNIGSESATKIYSDNQYVYLESADGQATIVRPPELDNNEATCITPFIFREGVHIVGKITNCNGKLVGIDYDAGTVVWAKNDMEQVFEIPEDANAADYEYVDGMFKVFPFMFPNIMGSTDVHTTDIHRTDNFLLVVSSGQGYLYRLNPMTLLGRTNLQIDQNNEILQCFENGSYIYIIGTTQIQKIPFITETRTLNSII